MTRLDPSTPLRIPACSARRAPPRRPALAIGLLALAAVLGGCAVRSFQVPLATPGQTEAEVLASLRDDLALDR